MKKIIALISLVIGQMLLMLAAAACVIFIIISFNQRHFEWLLVGGSLIGIILGVLLLKFAARTLHMSIADIIFDNVISLWFVK